MSAREVTRDPVGVAVIVYGPSDEPGETLRTLWSQVLSWLAAQGREDSVVSGRVVAEALAEQEALEPDTPELVAAGETAGILGVSRQRVHQLASRPDFPAPYARLGVGPIRTRPAVEAFQRGWSRRPGRRAAG